MVSSGIPGGVEGCDLRSFCCGVGNFGLSRVNFFVTYDDVTLRPLPVSPEYQKQSPDPLPFAGI